MFDECEKTLEELSELRKLAEPRKGLPEEKMFFMMMQIHIARGEYEKACEAFFQFDHIADYCDVDVSVTLELAKKQKSPEKATVLFNLGKESVFRGDEPSFVPRWIMKIIKAQVECGMVEEAKKTAGELKAFIDKEEIDQEKVSDACPFYFAGCSSEEFVERAIASCQTENLGDDVKEQASSMVMGNAPPGKLLQAKEKADSLEGLEKLDALLAVMTSLDPVKST
ncbi:hypothetical protein ACFLR2_02610 [Chlamydiota bacterium]